MRFLLLAVLLLLLSACTMPQRFAGHWTRVDESSGVFRDASGKRYFVNDHGLPRSVTRFVEAQPAQRDVPAAGRTSKSAYLEVTAYVDDSPPDCYLGYAPGRLPRLDVSWVRKIEPARPDFLAEMKKAKRVEQTGD